MKHVDHEIQAYCDGELSGERRAAFEDHLSRCAACRQALEATRRLWSAVDAAAEATPASDAWPGVAARLAARRRPGPWTWTQRGLAMAAVAAGVAIGLGLGSGRGVDASPRRADTASATYLQESLPTLDEAWLELGDSTNEDVGS